jgi:protein-disulfide isomerase
MGKDVNKLSLRSTLDVVTSIVLIAAAGTLAYRSVFVASSDTQAELQLPSEPMSIERAAIRGSEDAQAVMIVYSDFQCPFCARFTREALPEVERRYIARGRVALAFRHFPLPIHPHAVQAAAIAECAGRQGRFWEMHDRLFAERSLDADTLKAIPRSVQLDQQSLDNCLFDRTIGDNIQASVAEGRDLGIRGTPAFFIGTRLPDGRVKVTRTVSGARPAEEFIRALDSTLAEPGAPWRWWLHRLAS